MNFLQILTRNLFLKKLSFKFFEINIDLILKTIFLGLCLLITANSVRSQRQEFTKEEKAEIKEISTCNECDNPVVTVFKKGYEIEQRAKEESKATSAAYAIAKKWVTSSEIAAIGGGIAIGLLTPSDLADNDLDMDTDQPLFQEPPQHGLTVTTVRHCFDKEGHEIRCP